jgi:hypothetical protein
MRGRSVLQVGSEIDANCSAAVGSIHASLNFSNSNLELQIHHNSLIKSHHDCNNSTKSRAWGFTAVGRICEIFSRRLHPDGIG